MSQNLRLGIFIVITLAILATGVFLIGGRESMFRSSYKVKAEFDNVAGLNEGADVRVGGIRKGSVKKIQLPKRSDEKVTVMMDLEKETQNIVKTDSVADIKSEGMLGDKYIEITFGSVEAANLRGGETIGSRPPVDISDLFGKANTILDTTQGALDNVKNATSNISDISTKINHGQGTVGALINDKTIYNQAAATVTSMHEDVDALKHNFLLKGFFNKRGYVDSDELKKHEIGKLPAAPPLKSFSYATKQVFDKPDAAKLKSQKTLNDAGQFLQSAKFGQVVITAAAGMKGDSEKDRLTTQAQAMVIRNYLVQNFRLDDTRIKTMGLGKTADAGDDGKIEILVYPADASTASVQK
ncbi:MAG TPA: MlaD family protein [Bryobacteraceae bacterium]|jgi:phospholipid/cholesterol/gamma-HCH transport system substrate-binding protein|nr:MlaD family protein [Bryobacteraceae bacterium]